MGANCPQNCPHPHRFRRSTVIYQIFRKAENTIRYRTRENGAYPQDLATNQKVGSSNLSGRTIKSISYTSARTGFRIFDSYRDSYRPENLVHFVGCALLGVSRQMGVDFLRAHRRMTQ